MAFLSDGWLPRETRERYDKAPISRWESASRRAGVVEGLDQWRARLGALIERERADAAREGAPEWLEERVSADTTLLRFIEDFAARLSNHPDAGTWTECLAALRPLLREYVQDVEDVVGHLDQLAQLDELLTEPVPFARFLDTVRAEIQALKAGDLDDGAPGRVRAPRRQRARREPDPPPALPRGRGARAHRALVPAAAAPGSDSSSTTSATASTSSAA